ncbi:MAG: hypothetical protein EBX52_00655 [Proteobacteria bacterium]|nr:hypothetical protein [Pseudomonadota bacterium]
MPMGLTSEVKMPSALHYDTGKKIMIPLNDTTLSGQGIDLAEFSLIYAEVRSTGGVRVVSLPELETNLSEIVQLAQEGEPQLAARMGMNLLLAPPEEPVMMPSEILVARVVNGKPVTGLDLVVIGSRDGSRIMQRLQVDLVPLEDETLP